MTRDGFDTCARRPGHTARTGADTACRRYCLALDLKDDPRLIEEYEEHHRRVWPEILESIAAAGILSMEIYRVQNRMIMVMEVGDSFSFERKAAADAANPRVQAWEALMWKYQQAIPGGPPGAKWRPMDRVFAFPPSHGPRQCDRTPEE
jgi:L-rhamnose mutarotase